MVFKAVQQTTGKTVAVRLIERGLSHHASLENLTRQAQELTALNRATEPGVIDQGAVGEEVDFVVTELVAESPLADMIQDLLQESKSAGQSGDHGKGHVRGGSQLPNKSFDEQALRSYFPEDSDGVPCVAGSQVTLKSVVSDYERGDRPEVIQRRFPDLSLEQIYGIIAYYLGNRQQMQRYLRASRTRPDRTGTDDTAPPSDIPANIGNAPSLDLAGQTTAPSKPRVEDTLQTAAPSTPDAAPPSAATVPKTGQNDDATVAPSGLTPPTTAPLHDGESAQHLGPYELINKLGEGGMGAVYLARQSSLDRKVAIKVLNSRLSDDASFVARFTREAYAAAQLTHHNIVQIHDLGEEKRIHYFSMEFVDGQTLNNLLKGGGRVEPALAANYILQAARGLKFAHDHAMIHRDIKPHNLMLNDQGLVKVVDLGLVKRKGISDTGSSLLTQASDASMTGAAAAMGTPAYMAPEQAKDAASVDARADIYSLGCAFYYLLTGRPPFIGATAVEVITKHATEPVIPPEKIVRNLPKALSTILLKMMAKRPEDRYPSMADVIKDLEHYLAVTHGITVGVFTPQEHHIRGVELSVKQFNSVAWDYVRKAAIWTYFGIGVVGLLATVWGAQLKGILRELWALHLKIAEGLFGLMVMTFLWYVVVSGFSRRAYLTRQFQQFVSTVNPLGWIKAALAAVVVVGILAVFHLHLIWLLCLLVSFPIALAFHFTIDRALSRERRSSLHQLEAMCKTMRQQGMEEDELRAFVCERSGSRWEEVYASLFGSQGKMSASLRQKLAERGLARSRWGALGNPIIEAVERKMQRSEEQRRAKYFAQVEERRLVEQGMDQPKAQKKARVLARELIEKARQLKKAVEDGQAGEKAAGLLVDDVDGGQSESGTQRFLGRIQRFVLETLLGPQARLFAGLAMLAIFALWLKVQYPRLPTLIVDETQKILHRSQSGDHSAATEHRTLTAETAVIRNFNDGAIKTFHLSGSARQKTIATENRLLAVLGSWKGGLFGALLMISSLFSRRRVGLMMLASALLIFGSGHFLRISTANPSSESIGMILGTIVATIGFFLGSERLIRRRRPKSIAIAQTPIEHSDDFTSSN